MYLAEQRKKVNGKVYGYWVLRETIWDKKGQRSVQRYVAYLGTSRTITRTKAKQLAEKIGCSVDDLSRVRRLRILENSEATEAKSKHRAAQHNA